MKKFFLCLLAWSLTVLPALPQQKIDTIVPAGNWNKVQSLPQGARIALELRDGAVVRGEFVRLNADSISIQIEAREIAYQKDRVSRVKWERPGSYVKRAAIVGGVGFGVGFGIGAAGAAYIMDKQTASASERLQVGALMGGLLGGIAAGIVSIHRPSPREELIYVAK